MRRARPADDEHGRYKPSSEAKPSEGSAGWGQARGGMGGNKERVPIAHACRSPRDRCQGPSHEVVKGAADGDLRWPPLPAAHDAPWTSKRKVFNLCFIFPPKISEFASSVEFG